MKTNADFILESLAAAGIDLIFTCPGTTEVPLLDASLRHETPRFVVTTHESTAVAAADGYSRATGKIGVALLHANVGLANGLTMAEAATRGRSRVLLLNGTKPIATRNQRGFTQTPESVPIARPFTVQATTVASDKSFDADVSDAIARLNRPDYGTVYLELPQDLTALPRTEVTVPVFRAAPSITPSEAIVLEAVDRLVNADRVALIAGSDLDAESSAILERIADLVKAPLFEAPWRELERSTVSTHHPRYAGIISYVATQVPNADVWLFGSPRIQEPDDGPSLFDSARSVSHLQDSPVGFIRDAFQLLGSYRETLELIEAELQKQPAKGSAAYCDAAVTAYRATLVPAKSAQVDGADTMGTDGLSSVTEVAAYLSQHNTAGQVVLDVVTASAAMLVGLRRGTDYPFFATGTGALGWGPGAAVGVALGLPEQRTLAVVSDGVMQFGLQSLHTAVAQQVPITFLVLNNSSYHAVSMALTRFGGEAKAAAKFPCTDLGTTRFDLIGEGYGTAGFSAATIDELDRALHEASTLTGPAVIDMRVSTVGAGNTMR